MLVNEWVETLWSVLNVRDKTIQNYKHLYKHHLKAVIGNTEIDLVQAKYLQVKLISLPPQTARHTLMLAKTIWREAENYGVATNNPLAKLRTAPIQMTPKKFLTWEEVDSLKWGRYNNQIRFLALHGLRWSEAAALTIGVKPTKEYGAQYLSNQFSLGEISGEVVQLLKEQILST